MGKAGDLGQGRSPVQSIDDAPRYHLDIETDDVEAEVARLTALGATPVHSPPELFDAQAQTWP